MWAKISPHKRNRYGDIGSPCRHPRCRLNHGDGIPFVMTHDFISVINNLIHLLIMGPKLKKDTTFSRKDQEIESKAFSNSISSKMPGFLFLYAKGIQVIARDHESITGTRHRRINYCIAPGIIQ